MKRFRRQSILHMLREEKQNRNRGFLPDRSVFRWILISFSIASLVFCVVLIPLAAYCQNVFTELEYQKINQKLDSGISQINNTVTNLNELSKIFSENPYFIPIRYSNADYAAIDETTRLQMKYFYSDLVFPLSLVTDSALLFSQNVAITPANVFLNDMQEGSHFYPDYFCVNHLSYEEWNELLSEKKTGFLPVSQVNTKTQTYDALIYIAPLLKSPYFHAWTKSSYLYATIKIEDIQQILIHESDLDSIYLHITDKNENILYSNLPEEEARYHTISQDAFAKSLCVTLYIPKSTFLTRMKPFYLFLGIYMSCCILVLIITILISSRLSSKPIVTMIEQYQTTIYTQQKVLQARFLEKALNSQLTDARDQELFHTYFPDFPASYSLVNVKLWENPSHKGTVYAEALSIIWTYLDQLLPNAYLQQISDMELLLIIAENDYEDYCEALNFTIRNINEEEPAYRIRALASDIYQDPANLPAAYAQLQDLNELKFTNMLSQVCTITDSVTPTDPFVKALVDYIDSNYTDSDLCLTALEDQFHCSSSKIQRAFKNSMGFPISDYILQKRMDLANELLLQKERSITDIALSCGFTNSNSFYRAYLRVYGVAPSYVKEKGGRERK